MIDRMSSLLSSVRVWVRRMSLATQRIPRCDRFYYIACFQLILNATRDLLYDIDINDADCVESVNSMFGAILRAIREVMCVFIQDADYTEETRALLIIKSCIDVISAMVPILDYFDRNGHTDDHNMAILEKLRTYTAFIVERLFEPSTVVEDQHDTFPEELTDKTHVNSLFLEHRTYAIRQVQTYLRTNWSKHNGRYFVRRGREPREVETEIMKSKEIVAVHHAKSSLVEAADLGNPKSRMLQGNCSMTFYCN